MVYKRLLVCVCVRVCGKGDALASGFWHGEGARSGPGKLFEGAGLRVLEGKPGMALVGMRGRGGSIVLDGREMRRDE